MTNKELIAKAREIDSEATPGPWLKHFYDGGAGHAILGKDPSTMKYTPGIQVCAFNRYWPIREDYDFMLESRQLVPDLGDALEKTIARIEELEAALKETQHKLQCSHETMMCNTMCGIKEIVKEALKDA